jgi:hypothetical protein
MNRLLLSVIGVATFSLTAAAQTQIQEVPFTSTTVSGRHASRLTVPSASRQPSMSAR